MTDLEHRTGDGHGSGGPGNELATVDDARFPVPDPGEPEHLPRLTDVDEDAADRATRQVATMFGVVPILALIFVVSYFAIPKTAYIDFGPLHSNLQNVVLGLTLGLALVLIGIGAIQWARQLMDDHEAVDYRHGSLPPATRSARRLIDRLEQGIDESQITRRKVLGRSLLGALGLVALPGVVLLADLGPWPTRKFISRDHRDARSGRKASGWSTTSPYVPIKADQVQIGQLVNAQPENLQDYHGTEFLMEKAKASIIVVRMDPNTIKIPDSRKDWHVGGILCYSKICTHVGCPISLWEQQTHHLLCPCHQSTFDLGDSGVVVFGPAGPLVAPAPDHRRRRGVSGLPGRLQRAHRPQLLRAGLPQRLPAG